MTLILSLTTVVYAKPKAIVKKATPCPVEFRQGFGIGNRQGFVHTEIQQDSVGTPILNIAVVNNTKKDIQAFEFTCSFTDDFGRPVHRLGTKSSVYKAIVQRADLHADFVNYKKGEFATCYNVYRFNLALYELATTVDCDNIKTTIVKFTDGSIWKAQ